MNNNNLHTSIIFEVLKNQGNFLPSQTEALLTSFDKIYTKKAEIEEKYNPDCLVFVLSQDECCVDFGVKSKDKEMHIFYDQYELSFNDGSSFGATDLEFLVPEHPTEDLFTNFRSELLNRMFFIWFLEIYWKSNLYKWEIPTVFSQNYEYNEMIDMKNGWWPYENFEFLHSKN